MQFRLTYQGPLLSEAAWKDKQKDRPLLATNKQEIRKKIHSQIKNLWSLNETLKRNEKLSQSIPASKEMQGRIFGTIGETHTINFLSKEFDRFGFNFVPLLTEKLQVTCELDVLLLRPGKGGKLLNAGDIDNRLKTLFDALAMPQFAEQLGSHSAPADDESPFFCLLEDDSLISKVTVEVDALLEPVENTDNDARAIITVKTRPYVVNSANIAFA